MADKFPATVPANDANADPRLAQPALRSIVFSRSFALSAVVYLLLLCALFWRLFIGQIWNSNAVMRMVPPFVSPRTIDAVPFVCFLEEDFSDQFIFFQEYQYRSAQQGRFPTWNPHIYMGQPFHADGQSAMLFPFDWIYFLVEPDSARGWIAIARLWLSGAALFCLLRKADLAPLAAFTGGAVWMFCSFNMHWLAWPQSNASLWMPVLILAVDYLLVRPGLKLTAVASLAAAPLLLGGHPGTEYVGGLTVGFYALCRLISLRYLGVGWRGIALRTGALGIAMILGLLIAAAALFPLWMQIRQSFEYLDPAGLRGIVPPLPAAALWLMLIPELFGRSRGAFPSNLYVGPDNYVEMSLWFGALAMALALCTIASTVLPGRLGFKRLRGERFGFLIGFGIAAMLLSLLMVFCVEPVNTIATHLPGAGLTSLRRLQMASDFSGAVLAAVCVHRIIANTDRAMSVLASLIAVALCALAMGEVIVHWRQHQQELADSFVLLRKHFGELGAARLGGAMLVQSAVWRMRAGVLLLVAGTTSLVWMTMRTLRGRRSSPALRGVFIAMVTLDVMLPAVEWQPIAPRDLALPQAPEVLREAIEQSAKGRMLATEVMLSPNVSMHFGFKDTRGYEFPHSQRLAALLKRLKIDDFARRGLVMSARFYPHLDPDLQTYLDRTCVMCMMTRVSVPRAAGNAPGSALPDDSLAPAGSNRAAAAADTRVMIFANPNAYPRAYLAQNAVAVNDPRIAMEALLDWQVDLRYRSVFEGPGESQMSATADPAGDSATITTDEPEKIDIATQTSSRKLLVLADRMDIGWQVTLDGQPAEALTANYLFRGVFVPPGNHAVEWTYHAPGLVAGVVTSVGALLLALGTLGGTMLAEAVGRRR